MNTRMKHVMSLLVIVCVLSLSFSVPAEETAVMRQGTGLGANDLGDVVWDGSTIWVTGSGTLTKKLWGDGRRASDWLSVKEEPGFGQGTMGAILASEDLVAVSWLYSVLSNDQVSRHGDGFSISTDGGATWQRTTILDIFPERSVHNNPGIETVTWDFDYDQGRLYAASTFGFLLSSDDLGSTWKRYLPASDTTLVFQNPNHHGQCVTAYGDTIWVGTFQGMNASFDGGETWDNFSWPNDGTATMDDPKPGNFCYAVERQVANGKTHIWVGTQPFNGLGLYGICKSSDNGQTWEYKSVRYNAWNFVFGRDDTNNSAITSSTVFAASDSGLIVSHDMGDNWTVMPIAEPDSLVTVNPDGSTTVSAYQGREWDAGMRVYGLTAVADTLWATSSDGIAKSTDWGESWTIFKGVRRVRTVDTGERDVGISSLFDKERTYAFPNPFSPSRSDQDYGRTRVQYALTNDARVTISIRDFSGRLIRELLDDEYRIGGRDYQEVWDGRDADNEIVPNGVYFYIIKTNKGDSARGKIMVVD